MCISQPYFNPSIFYLVIKLVIFPSPISSGVDISDLVSIFYPCISTTVVSNYSESLKNYTPQNLNPVILRNMETIPFNPTRRSILRNWKLSGKVKGCSAFIITNVNLDMNYWEQLPFFGHLYSPQYVIFIVNPLDERHFRNWIVQSIFNGNKNVASHIDIYYFLQSENSGNKNNLAFYYLNKYFASAKTKLWLEVKCTSVKFCFSSLEQIAEQVSQFNKYHWQVELYEEGGDAEKSTAIIMQEIFVRYGNGKDYKTNLKLLQHLSFDHYISNLVFSNVFVTSNNNYTNNETMVTTISYKLSSHFSPAPLYYKEDNERPFYILWGELRFNFLSCHGVGSKIFDDYLCYDKTSWTMFLISLGGVFFILQHSNKNKRFLLLLSLMFAALDVQLNARKFGALFWLWIWTSNLLSHGYRSVFTANVIIPFKPSKDWDTIYDVVQQNFTLLYPLSDTDATSQMYATLKEQSFDSYSSLVYTVATLGNGSSESEKLKPFFDHVHRRPTEITFSSMHYRFPNQFLSTVTNCQEKIAYIDWNRNVLSILEYLGEVGGGIKYAMGNGQGFFSVTLGWQFPPLRNNFVMRRFGALISSGIYDHWNDWYAAKRPEQLFSHYANWTTKAAGKQRFQKANLNSKIVSVFYIYGICIVVCIVVFSVEMVKYNSNSVIIKHVRVDKAEYILS